MKNTVKWISMLKEKPVHGPWQTKGFCTFKIPGYPKGAAQGTFVTKREYYALNGRNKEINWHPYANSRERHNMDEVLFVFDESNLVIAEEFILAWMPYPAPADIEYYQCADCHRVCIRANENQKRCKQCQAKYTKSKDYRTKKAVDLLIEQARKG